MIKYLKIALVLIVFISCNSNEKKATKTNKESNIASKESSSTKDKDESNLQTKDQETLIAESIARGKSVYSDMCITCHMPNGQGVPKAFPPVADSDFLREKQNESIKGIKKGMSGEMVVNGVTYNSVMSPLGLSNKEVADVMNYINNSWGNEIDNYVTPEKVSKL